MKEKSFRFRESFGTAIKAMNDKQAGKFVKALCDFAFEGKVIDSNDSTLKSSFSLVRTAIVADKRNQENGRLGGIISAENRRQMQDQIMILTQIIEDNCQMENVVKDVFEEMKKSNNHTKTYKQSVAK